MNLPEIGNNEDIAINTVVSVVNKAQDKLGIRQNLFQLANSRGLFGVSVKVNVATISPPIAITSEALIAEAIEKKWKLTDTLMYVLKYLEQTQDEASQYYYYEAIFSQPNVRYPIPQATVSVFFRVQVTHTDPPEIRGKPHMIFRLEGHHTEHDVRYVKLTVDWILAVMKMKLKLFQRIENLRAF